MKVGTRIIIFVVITIAVLGITYIATQGLKSKCPDGEVYDEVNKRCRPECKDGQKYYPDYNKCLDCPPHQTLSNGQCVEDCSRLNKIDPNKDYKLCGKVCYDSSIDACDSDGKKCGIYKFNEKTGKCCGDGEVFDSSSGKCVKCPKGHTMCNGVCCEKDEKCVGGVCCPASNIHNGKCCEVYSSEDGCCAKGETSDGKNCKIVCGNATCNRTTQACTELITYDKDGKVAKKTDACKTKECTFDQHLYDPEPISGHPVCRRLDDVNNEGPFATCKVSDIANYVKTDTGVATGKNCTLTDCYDYMKDQGIEKATFDGKKCKATMSCAIAAGTKEKCGDCPVGKGSSQCCHNEDGSYSGLMCGDGNICMKDEDNHFVCGKGYYGVGDGALFQCKIADKNTPFGAKIYSTKSECLKDSCISFDNPDGKHSCCLSGWTYDSETDKCYQTPYVNNKCDMGQKMTGGGIMWSNLINDYNNIRTPPNCKASGDTYYQSPCGSGGCGPQWGTHCFKTGGFFGTTHPKCTTGNLYINPDSVHHLRGKKLSSIRPYCSCKLGEKKWSNFDNSDPSEYNTGQNEGGDMDAFMCNVGKDDEGCGPQTAAALRPVQLGSTELGPTLDHLHGHRVGIF